MTDLVKPVEPPAAHSWPARAGGWLGVVVRRGLLDPIEDGRLRTRGLREPTKVMVWLLTGVLLASLVVIAAAPWLRGQFELDAGVLRYDSAPAALIWLPLAIASLAVSLVLTAALHAPWWARLLGQAVAAVYFVDLTLKSLTADPGATWVTAVVTALFAAQLGLLAVRASQAPAWWEPLALWTLTVAVLVVTASPRLHPGLPGDGALLYASWESLVMISVFVLPVVYASAIGAAQVAVGLAGSAVAATAPRVGRLALLMAAGALLLAGAGAALAGLAQAGHGLPALAAGAGALAVFAAGWRALDLLARRRGASPPGLGELERVFGAALLVGLLVHLNLVVSTIARLTISGGQLIAVALGRPEIGDWARGLEGPLNSAFAFFDTPASRIPVLLVMLAVAAWWAASGRRGPAQLLFGAAVILSPVALAGGFQAALTDLIPVLAGLALCGACAWLIVRRRLSGHRLSALAVGGLLILVFHHTGILSSPLGLIFTGSGALIFGLAWGFLTGSGFANSGGRRWPRESRVWLVLSQFVLTAAMLVLTALFADPTRAFDTNVRDALGSTVLGNALLACALAACLSQSLTGSGSEADQSIQPS